jgi:hypothetical protein
MIRRITGAGLATATAYVTQDAINDLLTYNRCKAMVMEKAQNHERFTSALGANNFSEFEFGPWYDSSVSFTHGGMVASVTLPCRGPHQGSDITIKVCIYHIFCIQIYYYYIASKLPLCCLSLQIIRKGGFRWPLLYTLTGGEWEPMIMDAKIGMGAGGNLTSMSLLEQREPNLDGSGSDGGGAAAAHPHIQRVKQPPPPPQQK